VWDGLFRPQTIDSYVRSYGNCFVGGVIRLSIKPGVTQISKGFRRERSIDGFAGEFVFVWTIFACGCGDIGDYILGEAAGKSTFTR
ncbi:MAG: hypothetical protein ACKOI1_07365, partial [Bacteroidota bacterium]